MTTPQACIIGGNVIVRCRNTLLTLAFYRNPFSGLRSASVLHYAASCERFGEKATVLSANAVRIDGDWL